jgi:hypothetical protein
MEEGVGPGEDPDMLGDRAGLHAKEHQRSGNGRRRFHLDHHTSRAVGENLARARLAPVPAVGRDPERLGADDLAPDAPGETEAVAANATQARLVVVRCAEPGSRNGDDAGGIGGGHNTDPSCPPSFVA